MGGKAFPDTVPIPVEDYVPLIDQIIKVIPTSSIHDVASVGSGTATVVRFRNKPLNDIDIAVAFSDEDWVLFLANLADFGFQTKTINNHTVSVRWPFYDVFYQVDFLHTRRLSDAHWIYYTDYESKYKSAHKNIWIQAVINVLTTKVHTITGVATIRIKQHYDFYDGLVLLIQKKINPQAQRYTTIDRIVIDDRPYRDVIDKFIPTEKNVYKESFENLFADTKKHYSEVMFRKFVDEFVSILKTCNLEIPSECQV
jgi:hypothetical protein